MWNIPNIKPPKWKHSEENHNLSTCSYDSYRMNHLISHAEKMTRGNKQLFLKIKQEKIEC